MEFLNFISLQRFVLIALISFISQGECFANSPWDSDYFPNTQLINQDGQRVNFFDDLIKNKIVVINFIYTTCPDTCPLETAQLTRVQRILDDRLGKDIFFYSISIDPERDTPSTLKEYREKFGAKWDFFTGEKKEIDILRKKLGLYISEIDAESNNHNVNMIIGNQTTGRWMKRSPFENPYVLADQIGNWLDGWKAPQHVKNFASAPDLRNISDGEKLFRTRCMSCHSINGSNEKLVGPDLLGVTKRREENWLRRWLYEPDKMLAEKDPIAIAMYKAFNEVPMPNMRLTPVDISDLVAFMKEKDGVAGQKNKSTIAETKGLLDFTNARISKPFHGASMLAAYASINNQRIKPFTITEVISDEFENIEIHQMSMSNGMMEMSKIAELKLPARKSTELKPGGLHLMLQQSQREIQTGDEFVLTFKFSGGYQQRVKFYVN